MFDRVTLSRELLDARGAVLARKGTVISVTAVVEAARRGAGRAREQGLEASLAADLLAPLADPPYRHLFREPEVQRAVARTLEAIRLPRELHDELAALDPLRYRHAVATAAVSVRLLLAAVGEAPALAQVAAAGLLHDIGMRHVGPHLVEGGEALGELAVMEIARHPLLGGYRLALALGDHPAVEAALAHHWRGGHGYPSLRRAPSRSAEVVAVASAFAALTQPRPYRSAPFEARGAVDVLVCEARAGRADSTTVRLLIHALRGARGDVKEVRFGRERLGAEPAVNRHTRIAPAHSQL